MYKAPSIMTQAKFLCCADNSIDSYKIEKCFSGKFSARLSPVTHVILQKPI